MKGLDKAADSCARWPIEAAAAGDDAAFLEIARRMGPLTQSILRSFADSGVEAEDLAQESLVGLLAAVRTYRADGGAAFTTYASACIRNRLVSLIRRQGSHGVTEEPYEEDTQLPDVPQADPAVYVQAHEAAEELCAKLRQRLTPLEYRVLLARLGHRPYRLIAAELGISEKAVDNAVQRLRRKMAD